ncbi:transcription factor TFIIIC subunit tfc4 [Coemansia sp. RSA 1939]|nr:transcription factor TFIIIC subunit tfc4 [Coemansia sp. RSA 1939]KAJ2615168.1 transcription factor TFIIIC subunit tfc4 [Coemansia sp. RSA 1804]
MGKRNEAATGLEEENMDNNNAGSDDEAQYNSTYDEAALMNAVRSAAEMLAAEGLGNMVDIDSIQRQQEEAAAAAAGLDASGMVDPQYYEHNEDDDQGSGYYSSSDSDSEGNSDNDNYIDKSSSLLTTQLRGLSIPPQRRMSTRRTAAAVNNDTVHREQAADDGSEDNAQEAVVEEGDDDEDSNYRASDASSLSGDDEFHIREIHNAMRVSTGIGRSGRRSGRRNKKRKPGRPRGKQSRFPVYSHEVNHLLGMANRFYVEKELTQAFNTFCDVIRIEPSCAAAWNTMALIREEQGKYSHALQLLTVAAHMNPTDNALWERLYSMHMDTATQLGASVAAGSGGDAEAKKAYAEAEDQALYCIAYVTRNTPLDKDAWARKLALLEKRGNQKAIAKSYRSMLRADPYSMDTIRVASVLYAKQLDDIDAPIAWFAQAIEFYNNQAVEIAEKAVAQTKVQGRKSGGRGDGDFDDSEESSDVDSEDEGEDVYSIEWVRYFRNNPIRTVPMEDMGGYSYSDLNMLAELRLLRREYETTIAEIKRGARFIQGRGRDTAWVALELDDQDDTEYESPDQAGADNQLPIELRVKLGLCRLMLGHAQSAEAHINRLFAVDPVVYEDLYTDVADAYAELGHSQLAVRIYTMLTDHAATDQPSVWERLAKCHRDAGDLASAGAFAQRVIEADPNDLDMRLWLGELYEEMGEVRLAYEMISTAEAIQQMGDAGTALSPDQQQQQQPSAVRGAYRHRFDVDAASQSGAASQTASLLGGVYEAQSGQAAAATQDYVGGLLHTSVRQPSEHTLQKRRNAEEERTRCLAAMRSADVAFRKLDLLKPLISKSSSNSVQVGGDREAVADYCTTARRLFDDWRHMGAFYMTDRSRPFRNYRSTVMSQLESSASSGDIDILSPVGDGQAAVQRRLARMKKRLADKQQQNQHQPTEDNGGSTPEDGDEDGGVATTFRAQLFGRWLDMFLFYAKCLVLQNKHQEALDMLDIVFQSNVFVHNVGDQRVLKLMMIMVAMLGGLEGQIYDLVRWWCGGKPAKAMVYKLFGYALASSASGSSSLTTSTMYKFVRRLLQHLDDMHYSKQPADAEGAYPLSAQQRVLCREGYEAGEQGDAGLRIVYSGSGGAGRDGLVLTRSDVSALHSIAAHVMRVSRVGVAPITQHTLGLALVPEDASLALHLSVAYLVHSVRMDTPETKQGSVLRGLVYLQRYAELRHMQAMEDAAGRRRRAGDGKSGGGGGPLDVVQEIAYNFARAFHFLGLLDLAVTYYERVFELPTSLSPAGAEAQAIATCDLRREAAYNLASIYTLSGLLLKARAVLKEHCTID